MREKFWCGDLEKHLVVSCLVAAMAGRYGNLDYPKLTKRGVFLGLALFGIGALGEVAVHVLGIGLPGWEQMLLFDAEVVGVLLMLLVPFVFGILLPLTE